MAGFPNTRSDASRTSANSSSSTWSSDTPSPTRVLSLRAHAVSPASSVAATSVARRSIRACRAMYGARSNSTDEPRNRRNRRFSASPSSGIDVTAGRCPCRWSCARAVTAGVLSLRPQGRGRVNPYCPPGGHRNRRAGRPRRAASARRRAEPDPRHRHPEPVRDHGPGRTAHERARTPPQHRGPRP